ncbi:uncharacterized protein LOC116287621 [Actinia tenebrosa]|uniref:Uncharacterized protein LOC116287621 n=1 Tax=Actinia tenebrosa TaxID=6105 RepID=A0A6P8HCB9_ACTTE|nr:uncharacterized protein LOC116287621 [Actinia tenebrosa]
MWMKIALITCLLVLISPGSRGITVPSCCPESQSPSGGPSQNTGAVVCYFRRTSLTLECIKGSSRHTCTIVRASASSEYEQRGPTPYGEYLIGKHRSSTTYPGLDWYRLYPKKEDNSGYYGYYSPNKKGRSTMGLHPGKVSWGCVTVATISCSSGSYSCYNSNSCWRQIKRIVNSGNMYYRGSSYSGILYVVP